MTVLKPTEILLISAASPPWLDSFSPEAYTVHQLDSPTEAMQNLRDTKYDLLVLQSELFEGNVAGFVSEVKRRVPLVPVLILSDESDGAFYTDLMEAGADDILIGEINHEEVRRRLRLILKQRRQNLTLAQRNHNLSLITMVSRRLHSVADPQTFVQEAIDLLCNTLKLYGAAIVIVEENMLKMFAGRAGKGDDRYYESPVRPQEYDPFLRVINTGVIQLYEDINVDQYYLAPPVLMDAHSAIIVPLNYQDRTIGALAAFGLPGNPLVPEDIAFYELFADQFTVAFYNIRTYESQHRHFQASQLLLRAWQRLVTLQTVEDVGQTLRELAEDFPAIRRALVCLYPDTSDTPNDLVISAHSDDMRDIFQHIYKQGDMHEVMDKFNQSLEPVILQNRRVQGVHFRQLFTHLDGQQLLLLPIVDSARVSGILIAGITEEQPLSRDDIRLMESLANTAGQVLERLTLMHIYLEKSGRLEAILRSVSEGIFFVDEHNCVVYCNPQFTELTGINRSEVLDQDSQAVLERLAQRSADVSQTLNLFQKAIISLPDAREYPIVEITLDNPRRQVHVELVVIENIGDSNVAWAGVIRDNQRFKNLFTNQMSLLGAMPQLTRVHYAEVRGLIATLVEQHNNMTSKDRHYLLRKVEHSLEKSSQLWDNFSELYSLEVTGLVLDREQIDPQELVQTVFDYRYFSRYRRRCDITAANRLSLVNVDAFHMRRALANVLHYALEETVPDSKVTINLERVGRNLNTTFQFTHAGGDKTNLDQIFEGNHKQSPTSDQSLETDGSIGLYLSNEIVRKHGGSIQTTTVSGNTTSIIVTLPAVPAEDEAETESPEDEVKEAVEPGALARVPARTPQKIMVFRGQSTVMEEMINLLTEQNYDLLLYQSTQDAMRDLGTTRLDLILLDARLPDDDSLQVCERIRKRTEVPLVVLADEPSNSEKILALNIGADDYISQPVDEEEMLARINVIFKRQQLPDRAREPLELGDLYIDFARREVFYHNRPIELTRIEYDLLRVLALNADQVLTHEQLLTQVWGPEYRNETHYLWVNVSRLRKKVEPTPDSPRFIHNQPGIGYVFRQP